MSEQVFYIFDMDRPACADLLMSWTFYMYLTTIEGIMCAQQELACVQYMEDRINTFIAAQFLLATPLYQIAGIDTTTEEFKYTLRPDGWADGWKQELEKYQNTGNPGNVRS
jgi:hypothetical protein